jgi:hypothetical protein
MASRILPAVVVLSTCIVRRKIKIHVMSSHILLATESCTMAILKPNTSTKLSKLEMNASPTECSTDVATDFDPFQKQGMSIDLTARKKNLGPVLDIAPVPFSQVFGTAQIDQTDENPLVENFYSRMMLPPDFTPSRYSVTFGRGKKRQQSTGTRRLRIIVGWFTERYDGTTDRYEKSAILTEIQQIVRNGCGTDRRGSFIRFRKGRWWEVDHLVIRDRIASIFRDCLHTKYRSSKVNKVEMRRRRQMPGNQIDSWPLGRGEPPTLPKDTFWSEDGDQVSAMFDEPL